MGKITKKEYAIVGWNYDKPDMARCGLFAEMNYLEGTKYNPRHNGKFNVSAYEGLQMLPGGPKIKSGLQDAYFEPKFNRIFIKEAYTNNFQLERKHMLMEKAKNISTNPMYPGSPTKWHSSPGDYYGTFISKMPAFSPKAKPLPKKGPWLPSIMTSPPKFFGCGYKDITIGPYPLHSSSPYTLPAELRKKQMKKHKAGMLNGAFLSTSYPGTYFGPNPYYVEKPVPNYRIPKKKVEFLLGGPFLSPGKPKNMRTRHIGCFSPFPNHQKDPYLTQIQVKTYVGPREKKLISSITANRMQHGQPFNPPNHLRTTRQRSIVNYNVDFRVNQKNWKSFKGTNRKC